MCPKEFQSWLTMIPDGRLPITAILLGGRSWVWRMITTLGELQALHQLIVRVEDMAATCMDATMQMARPQIVSSVVQPSAQMRVITTQLESSPKILSGLGGKKEQWWRQATSYTQTMQEDIRIGFASKQRMHLT